MKWKEFAIQLYFRIHGRRCVLCSKIVELKDAYIELKDNEHYLMHKRCKIQEKI
jgi:hypothetical protein